MIDRASTHRRFIIIHRSIDPSRVDRTRPGAFCCTLYESKPSHPSSPHSLSRASNRSFERVDAVVPVVRVRIDRRVRASNARRVVESASIVEFVIHSFIHRSRARCARRRRPRADERCMKGMFYPRRRRGERSEDKSFSVRWRRSGSARWRAPTRRRLRDGTRSRGR